MCTIEDTSRAHRSADKEESLCAKSFILDAKRRAIISANGRSATSQPARLIDRRTTL
jgi:hypothetical protein